MPNTQPTLEDVWRLFHETTLKFQETDRRFQETDRIVQETARKVKEMTASIGKLGNRLGDFIEDAVRPSAVRLFRQRGIEVHEVHQKHQLPARRSRAGATASPSSTPPPWPSTTTAASPATASSRGWPRAARRPWAGSYG